MSGLLYPRIAIHLVTYDDDTIYLYEIDDHQPRMVSQFANYYQILAIGHMLILGNGKGRLDLYDGQTYTLIKENLLTVSKGIRFLCLVGDNHLIVTTNSGIIYVYLFANQSLSLYQTIDCEI